MTAAWYSDNLSKIKAEMGDLTRTVRVLEGEISRAKTYVSTASWASVS